MRLAVGESLDAMCHGIDAGRRRCRSRNRKGQAGIDDGDIGKHVDAFDRKLGLGLRIGNQSADTCLAAGARCRRHLCKSHPASLRNLASADHLTQCLRGTGEDGRELGKIHGAAPAETDDQVGAHVVCNRQE